MILADTSAWIEYIRATGSASHVRLRALIAAGAELASTGPVVLELVAGARDQRELRLIRRMLAAFTLLPASDPDDYLQAAAIYLTCRAAGETIRSLADCLIAAVAIQANAQVLHHDRDFTAIARQTPLALA